MDLIQVQWKRLVGAALLNSVIQLPTSWQVQSLQKNCVFQKSSWFGPSLFTFFEMDSLDHHWWCHHWQMCEQAQYKSYPHPPLNLIKWILRLVKALKRGTPEPARKSFLPDRSVQLSMWLLAACYTSLTFIANTCWSCRVRSTTVYRPYLSPLLDFNVCC